MEKETEAAIVPSRWSWVDTLLLLLAGAYAFFFGGNAAYPGVAPGTAAAQLVADAGLLPDTSPLHPLWALLVKAAIRIGPSAGILFRIHLLGRICLAVAAACLYRTSLGLLRGLEGRDSLAPALHPVLLRIGAAAAPVLLLAQPVRFAAMAPDPSLLGIALTSVFALLATLQIEYRAPRAVVLAFGALCGIGCLESPGFLPVMPYWLLAVALAARPEGQGESEIDPRVLPPGQRFLRNLRDAAPVALFLAVFSLGVFWMALRFLYSDGAQFRNVRGVLDSMVLVLRELSGGWRAALPGKGLLLVLAGIYLPSFLAIRFSPWFFGERPNVYLLVMVAGMGIFGSMVLHPESPLFLAALLKSQEMRNAACFLCAFSGAFGLAYLLNASVVSVRSTWKFFHGEGDMKGPAVLLLETAVSIAAAVFTLFQIATGAAMRVPPDEADARARIAAHVRMLSQEADGMRYFVSDGAFDDLLRLEAFFRGRPLIPLCYSFPAQMPERRRTAFALDDPVDRQDYEIGMQNLLISWLSEHPERFGDMATQVTSSFWERAGLRIVPDRALLRVATPADEAAPALEDLLERTRPLWADWRDYSGSGLGDRALYLALRNARREIGLVANELGMQLEASGKPELACEAFSAARAIDALNLPARRNLDRLGSAPDPEALRQEVQMLARLYSGVYPEALMRFQGRFAEYADRSGRADVIADILRNGAVNVLLSASPEPPEKLLRSLLRHDRQAALHVRRLLAPMAREGGDENPTLWLLWGWCGLELEQANDVKTARWHLRGSRENSVRLQVLEAMREGNLGVLAERYRSLQALAPQDVSVLRGTLMTSMAVGDYSGGFRTAIALLQQAPDDPPALFAVGSTWLVQGKPRMALAYLLRAERAGEHSPSLFNNIAEAYLASGDAEKAHAYARRAHEALPDNEDVLDTLRRAEAAMRGLSNSNPQRFADEE